MIEAFRVGAVSRDGTLWDGLDMAFGDGEIWVVTGPPASGKTVLLNVLRGERRPDAGDVVAAGRSLYRGDADALTKYRASSGVVPETFPAMAGRKVRDLFVLSATAGVALRTAEREEREKELLAMMGLPGAQGWDLFSLSVSERARVALAAELLRGPRYLFADMLLANAGREWTEMMRVLFRALAREGRTIVLAERTLPDRWKAKGGAEGIVKGPFVLHRVPAGTEG